jgi:hypothetical protein
LLASCGGERGPARVEVSDAVVTLPAAGGRPGAAYFTLRSTFEARLTGIDSARAGRIELHEQGMRPANAFPVSPSEPLRFSPGGRHAMLFDLDPSLRPGARIALTFSFESAPPVTVEAEVRAAGDVHGH